MGVSFECNCRRASPGCGTNPSCPSPNPPLPPVPLPVSDILVAAGTGRDPHVYTGLTYNIPFGNTLYSVGDAVTHVANSPDFVITQSGDYEINYQLSAYNPALVESIDVDISTYLMSNNAGILDTVNHGPQFQLIQRRVVTYLASGTVLFLQATQPYLSEMGFNSMAMVITKLS